METQRADEATALTKAERKRADEATKLAEYYGDLLERVSVDSRFGILTFNSQRQLFEWMAANGKLKEMSRLGYTFEMVAFDINLLKMHNTLGTHSAGDIAMGAVIGRLNERIFRRRSDVLAGARPFGFLSHIREIDSSLKSRERYDQFGRRAGGDESFGMSFIPPMRLRRDGDRRRPVIEPDERRDTIIAALSGLEVEYPLTFGGRLSAIRQQFGLNITGDMIRRGENGGRPVVRVPVSAQFSIMQAPVPTSVEEFETLARAADDALMRAKERRQEIKTDGVVVDLAA